MGGTQVYLIGQLLCLYVSISFAGIHPDGVSEVARSQDDQGNYQFVYKVSDAEGQHFRQEGTDANGAVVGSYGFTEVDGRQRVVDYIADEHGFRAHVRTNEPGTADSSPAAVTIVKEDSSISSHNGPAAHLDLAATSLSASARSPTREQHPERVFGIRLTPISVQERNQDLVTPYVRNNHPGYQSEGISTLTDPKLIRPANSSPRATDPGIYYPPISPTGDFPRYQPARIPVEASPSQPTDTSPVSSVPFIPSYGGGYDTPYIDNYGNRNRVNRRPDVSMETIHGGYGRDAFVNTSPQQHYGVTRIRDNGPRRPDYPPVQDDRIIIPMRNDIALQSPNLNNPNLVLRAVPIPNGIQAVHVDPSTGEVHRNALYPAFDRQGRRYFNNDNRNTIGFNQFPNVEYLNYDRDYYPSYRPSAQDDTYLRRNSGTRRRLSNGPDNIERPVYVVGGVLSNRQPLSTPEDLNLSTPSARDLAGLPPYFRYGSVGDPGNYRDVPSLNPYLNVPQRRPAQDERYPAYPVVQDTYHPGYANAFDYDNGQSGFNPYYGALPSSPRAIAYPNYQRAGLLDSESNKNDRSAKDSRKSSVEFVEEESKIDETVAKKSR